MQLAGKGKAGRQNGSKRRHKAERCRFDKQEKKLEARYQIVVLFF